MKTLNRTIRQGVWETNSSSSHSVTIQTKGGNSSTKYQRPLVESNTLYPMRLSDYSVSVGYDGSTTVCDTKDEKAAIIFQWLFTTLDNEGLDELLLKVYQKHLREALGYTSVDFEGTIYCGYSAYDENDGDKFPMRGDESDYVTLDKYVQIALDDTKQIIDSDSPY